MRIGEIMISTLATLPPSATLHQAARKMREADIGFIPVVEDGRVVGTVTDRDICVRAVAEDQAPASGEVRSVMSAHCVCCSEDQDSEAAARLMAENRVRRLPVLDRAENLVGVLSLGDLAHRAQAEGDVGQAMGSIAEPSGGPGYL